MLCRLELALLIKPMLSLIQVTPCLTGLVRDTNITVGIDKLFAWTVHRSVDQA